MTEIRQQMRDIEPRLTKWRGATEHLHAEPGRSTGNTFMAHRAGKPGKTK